MGKDGKNAARLTTTFTKDQHDALQRIAKENRLTVAWLIRRAVDDLIEKTQGGRSLPFETK